MRSLCLLFCLGALLLSTPLYGQARDPFDAAKVAFAKRNYAMAVDNLTTFLAASIGNPHVDEARQMVVKVASAWEAELVRQNQPGQAAEALLKCAKLLDKDARADDLRQEAQALLGKEFAKAVRNKDHDEAIRIAEDFAGNFPDAPPLADDATIQSYKIATLAPPYKARPEFLYRRLQTLEKIPADPTLFKQNKVDPAGVALAYVKELQDRGWLTEAAAVAREALTFTPLSADSKKALERAEALNLIAAADAGIAFGNSKMARNAVNQCLRESNNIAIDPQQLGRVKFTVDRMPPDEPLLLTAAAPLHGNGTWADTGRGYKGDGIVQIGSEGGNHPDPSFDATIQVEPGFYLEGGVIDMSEGSITFNGTALKPIVLTNVRIECELAGTVKASYTLFRHCTFQRGGAFITGAGASSKWEFVDCLFQTSNFVGFSRIDYGIKAFGCTFSNCKFSRRDENGKPDDDGAKLFRGDWNQIQDCDFYDCSVSVSALWMTTRCNYLLSQFTVPDAFASSTDLSVEVAMPNGEDQSYGDLAGKTTNTGVGRIVYSRAPRLYPRLKPNPLWKLAEESATPISAKKAPARPPQTEPAAP